MKTRIKPVIAICVMLSIPFYGFLAYRSTDEPIDQVKPASAEVISAEAIYNVVNEERNKAGAPLMSLSQELNKSAQMKCDDMASGGYFEHTNPTTGKHGYEYAKESLSNASYLSENLILSASTTNRGFVQGWLDSPSHKAAMLDPRYSLTGLAICKIPAYPDQTAVVEHFAEMKKEVTQQTTNTTYVRPSATRCTTNYHAGMPEYGLNSWSSTSCY